ncbi:long-chain-fatty-acid--CoA ligase LcfB [Brevibacterium salitolerans]|uniref:Long-chain-fatty-acid--CoA ligase LcfB n=2 Tax=Brevibacteriaceae TaxID=85019 RepID=A0ABN2WZR7_9MICO
MMMTAVDMTIPQVLDAQAERFPEREFVRIVGKDEVLTFRGLAEESKGFARALAARGVGPGDRVAVAAENGREWLVAFFGVLRLRAIAVTINPLYREGELMHMLASTGTKAVVSSARSGEYSLAGFYAEAELPELETVVLIGEDSDLRPGQVSFEQVCSTGAGLLAPAEPPAPAEGAEGGSAGDAAVILFTSGTTGRAKGAVLTHASLLASAAAQVEEFGFGEEDRLLGIMPLNHVGGLTCTVLSGLLAGTVIEMLPRFHPTVVADLLVAGRLSVMVGVPTMHIMVLQDERLKVARLSAVRLCVIGGSNVESAVAAALAERFPNARLANLYGLSETSGACVISPAGVSHEELSASIGAPIGAFRAQVADELGRPLPAGSPGELQISGGCVFQGYWGLPEATAETLTPDGWLSTGDIAVMSESGRISLRGRSKEMYVRGGYNVYPAEVENVISAVPGVGMVAVVGTTDEKYGATGRAYVQRAGNRPGPDGVNEEEILAACRTALAEYKVPDSVVFVESLPLTPSGKIRKTDLGG